MDKRMSMDMIENNFLMGLTAVIICGRALVARFGYFGNFNGVVDSSSNFSKDNGDVISFGDFRIIMSIIHDMDEFM